MSLTLRRGSAPLALGLGPSVIVLAVMRNWHLWSAPPFWIDDLIAGGLLVVAGLLGLSDQDSLRGRLLTGAFALAVGVLWASLFEEMAGLHPAPAHWSVLPTISLIFTSAGLVAAVGGLLASLPSRRPPFVGTRPEPPKKAAARSESRTKKARR